MTSHSAKSDPLRQRLLSADEHELWSHVTKAVTRMKPDKSKKSDEAPLVNPITQRAIPSSPAQPAKIQSDQPKRDEPALAPFDRRLKQRLVRGNQAIDARIDLHGFTQAQAYDALVRFVRSARGDGARIVLVITGKGSLRGGVNGERGVLRRQVPLWLKSPQLRECVVGIEAAHFVHGGEGALYVRLRRERGRREEE